MVLVALGGGVECVKAVAEPPHSKVGKDFWAHRSWFRVRSSVLAAAGFFDRGEFHELDSRFVGVVEIELPFAVSADFWLFGALPAIFD